MTLEPTWLLESKGNEISHNSKKNLSGMLSAFMRPLATKNMEMQVKTQIAGKNRTNAENLTIRIITI